MVAADTQSEARRRALAKQESSVRHLQQLYTIVAGLALSDAVQELFRGSGWRGRETLVLLIAFAVTLVPFFHGAMRHLDDVYLINPTSEEIQRMGLAVDSAFLFGESVLLFAMAHEMAAPTHFAGFYALLLIVDIVWSLVSIYFAPRSQRRTIEFQMIFKMSKERFYAQPAWVKNNLLFLAVLAFCWLVVRPLFDLGDTSTAIMLMLIAVARTFRDYRRSWNIYFPSARAEEETAMTVIG